MQFTLGIVDIAAACLFAAGDNVEHPNTQTGLRLFAMDLMMIAAQNRFTIDSWRVHLENMFTSYVESEPEWLETEGRLDALG